MAEKCCATVYGDRVQHWPCGNKAKVQRNGRWFCGTHDPDRLQAIRDKHSAKWNAENKERWAKADEKARRLSRYDEAVDLLRRAADTGSPFRIYSEIIPAFLATEPAPQDKEKEG